MDRSSLRIPMGGTDQFENIVSSTCQQWNKRRADEPGRARNGDFHELELYWRRKLRLGFLFFETIEAAVFLVILARLVKIRFADSGMAVNALFAFLFGHFRRAGRKR